jgi:hypothetical protein
MNSKTFYLNPLFDLHIGNYSVDSVKFFAAEMSVLFLFCCANKDSLIIDIDIPDSYLQTLQDAGITLPKSIIRTTLSHVLNNSQGVSWGWSQQSIDRLAGAGVACKHPDLEIIKQVNNRKFCNEIGIANSLGVPGSQFCVLMCDFQKVISVLSDKFPLVIKPAFGGSGFGLKVINSKEEIQGCLGHIENCILLGGFILEPWCDRIYDLSTNLYLNSDGSIDNVRHQRLFSNDYGSFFGIYIAPHDSMLKKWTDKLEKTAILTAREISKTGYFGPLGFDSFVYKGKDGQEYLAPIIEINARHVMSHIAYAIRNQIASEKYCFFRMISKKRCKLPDNYEIWNETSVNLKNSLLVTPLRIRHSTDWIQPSRSAFFLFADTEEELFEEDRKLRLCVEKGRGRKASE